MNGSVANSAFKIVAIAFKLDIFKSQRNLFVINVAEPEIEI